MVEIEEEDDEIEKIVETNDMQKSGKRYPHCFYTQWFGSLIGMHSVQGATDGSILAFDGKRMGVGFGGGIFLGQLLTLSRIRYHVLHVYMHYGWLVGWSVLLFKVDQSVHITAQQYRRYSSHLNFTSTTLDHSYEPCPGLDPDEVTYLHF